MDNQLQLEPVLKSFARRGIRHSKGYKDIAAGLDTPVIRRGARSYKPVHETDALIKLEMAGASKDQIRTVVSAMVDARKVMA